MPVQLDAVTRLLRDDDPETVRLVKEQLLLRAEENPEDLAALADIRDGKAQRHIRDILSHVRQQEAEGDFDLFCRFFDDGGDIETALWLLAQVFCPAVEIAPYRTKLDQWGRQFAMRISGAISSRERVLALSDFMADTLCFRGNTDNYYCERNSLLPCVMDSRMGIPISLTLLYRMVALRAGMIVNGINLPGHFIARHEDIYFDPFHKGRILSREDCQFILLRQNLRLTDAHLLPAAPRQILMRVLANLLYVYDLEGNCGRHALTRTWLAALRVCC